MSSIFQQKTIKPDDIDAEFLKHVQVAAQRSSPTPAAPADPVSAFDVQTDFPAPDTVSGIAAPSNTSTLVMTQPVAIEEFTLDKIEQSIADIEAELGWTSEGAAATSTVSTAPASEDKVTSTAAPSGILSTAHASRFSAAPQAASAGKLCLCSETVSSPSKSHRGVVLSTPGVVLSIPVWPGLVLLENH